jgi:hypothetical protein
VLQVFRILSHRTTAHWPPPGFCAGSLKGWPSAGQKTLPNNYPAEFVEIAYFWLRSEILHESQHEIADLNSRRKRGFLRSEIFVEIQYFCSKVC